MLSSHKFTSPQANSQQLCHFDSSSTYFFCRLLLISFVALSLCRSMRIFFWNIRPKPAWRFPSISVSSDSTLRAYAAFFAYANCDKWTFRFQKISRFCVFPLGFSALTLHNDNFAVTRLLIKCVAIEFWSSFSKEDPYAVAIAEVFSRLIGDRLLCGKCVTIRKCFKSTRSTSKSMLILTTALHSESKSESLTMSSTWVYELMNIWDTWAFRIRLNRPIFFVSEW